MKNKSKKPFSFTAGEKSFTVQLDQPCVVTGYTLGNLYSSFYNHISVKKGDTFRAAKDGGGIVLNGRFIVRKARKPKDMAWRISWVAKRLRIAVFKDRDRLYSRRLRRFTKKLGDWYWTACDLRSYHLGCAETADQAIKNLILQVQATNLGAEEEKVQGHRVIRWRCLLPKKDVDEMEAKAKKTGFILEDVRCPDLPERWKKGLQNTKH